MIARFPDRRRPYAWRTEQAQQLLADLVGRHQGHGRLLTVAE